MTSVVSWIAALILLAPGQSAERPAYVREGDRIEQSFRAYRDRLNSFFLALRTAMAQPQIAASAATMPPLLPQDAPPTAAAASRYGYGILPRIVEATPPSSSPVSAFSYSWPITEGYIGGEHIRIDAAEAELRNVSSIPDDSKPAAIANLIGEYRKMLGNQRTIEQYIQYNQFWQNAIAQDRTRFDQLTKAYELMKSDQPDISRAIRDVLGKPDLPNFLKVNRTDPKRIVVRVPVYTDIEDDAFLDRFKSVVEEYWQASEAGVAYSAVVEIRKVPPSAERGQHIDVKAHAAKFPEDGAVLTTGAQSLHSLIGRYVALAPGDLSVRTLAHEFGHLLGFRDGYIRGYRDLGDRGFEILELTTAFDDIMSAPREGRVQPAHFKLILEAQ